MQTRSAGTARCAVPARVPRAEQTVQRGWPVRDSFRAAWARGRRSAPSLPTSAAGSKRRSRCGSAGWRGGFALPELMVVIAVLSILAAVGTPLVVKARAKSRLGQCIANLQQINRAVQLYAEENQGTLPALVSSPPPGRWWYYKEQIKGYAGITGPSSAKDKVFACPSDRGYTEAGERPQPFWQSKKYDYTSYVFNSVNLPGVPNVGGWKVESIKEPARTLSVMEWTAHAPLSWHHSRTGKANSPFYNDAESVVGFVDGHVAYIPIHYDGMNAAYTRDPIVGYGYRYSGN